MGGGNGEVVPPEGGRKRFSGRGGCGWMEKKRMEVRMQKRILIGLVLVAVLVIVAVNATTAKVSFDVFSLKWTMKTVYAMLASAGIGIAIGVLVRS